MKKGFFIKRDEIRAIQSKGLDVGEEARVVLKKLGIFLGDPLGPPRLRSKNQRITVSGIQAEPGLKIGDGGVGHFKVGGWGK